MTIEASRYFLDPGTQRTLTVRTVVSDVEELLALLRKLSDTRQSVDLEAPNGNVLCVGVGVPDGWACFGTPTMVAQGDAENLVADTPYDSDEIVEFLCGGEPTEIRRRDLVPFEQVLSVAEYFMHTHSVPRNMRWR